MTPILEVKNLSKTFYGVKKHVALSNVSFDMNRGEVVCLVGPSGSGKSTLLRCLAGLEEADKGEIVLLGEHNISQYDEKATDAIKDNISFVFQDFNLWPHKTVMENITFAPVLKKKMSVDEAKKTASSLLKRFDLYDKKDIYPDFLSGGQKQRVAIIRALAMQPKLLLLDEITSALDPELISSVFNLIKILAKEGQSMLIVTHHLKFATEIADKILFLDNGHLVQESSARDFVFAQKNPRIADFLRSVSLDKEEISIYRGTDQFQAFQIGVLKRLKSGSSICVPGSSGDRWFDVMGDSYKIYDKERIEKNISWKMTMYEESPRDKETRLLHPELNEYRLMPKNLKNPANYFVVEDAVVIQVFGEKGDEPAIIEIKNKSVAESYMSYFKLLWDQSEPIK
ncbi:MAG: amino acid ABC transporter ATP-binding protein [bacterium]|nr:amino acid ABC transporter ATP-binding protein [bacterium]